MIKLPELVVIPSSAYVYEVSSIDYLNEQFKNSAIKYLCQKQI